ncbi:MAG TPA: flagellar basal body rod protein FlgC [Opitutaceae bacterium]|nr:flagellar basal body rod protein FlgC [Opitutaceae bacterium]
MNLISGIDVTSGALNSQRTRLDVVAQNIANAQTTRGLDGLPYQRKVVSFEGELLRKQGLGGPSLQTVKVAEISTDRSPGQRVYDPQHPDAGSDGMVQLPNVNLAFEMVDLITASRAYEANLSVVKNARQMAMKALQIGV